MIKKEEKVDVIKTSNKQIRMPLSKDAIIIAIIVSIVILLTAGIIAYYYIFANNEVVGTYDGGKITKGEYEMYYKTFAPMLAYYGYTTQQINTYVGNKIIGDKIVLTKALEEGYKLSENNKSEIDELFSSAEDIASISARGINPDKLKKLYYEDTIITEYINKMREETTTEQMRAYLIQTEGPKVDLTLYKTSHILFEFTDGMTDVAKSTLFNKANDILKKAIKGEDFAGLAKEYSGDGSASNGGVVEVTNSDKTFPEYIKAVLTLEAGKIYPKIVETSAGYHVIKLNSKEKEGRLINEEEIGDYVNSRLNELQLSANHKFNTERIEVLAQKMNLELGIEDNI